MGLIVVFNGSETSAPLDEDGRVVEPHGWGVADADYVADALAAGRLLEADMSAVKEGDSNPAVIMAKKELEDRQRLAKPAPAKEPAAEAGTEAPAEKK